MWKSGKSTSIKYSHIPLIVDNYTSYSCYMLLLIMSKKPIKHEVMPKAMSA